MPSRSETVRARRPGRRPRRRGRPSRPAVGRDGGAARDRDAVRVAGHEPGPRTSTSRSTGAAPWEKPRGPWGCSRRPRRRRAAGRDRGARNRSWSWSSESPAGHEVVRRRKWSSPSTSTSRASQNPRSPISSAVPAPDAGRVGHDGVDAVPDHAELGDGAGRRRPTPPRRVRRGRAAARPSRRAPALQLRAARARRDRAAGPRACRPPPRKATCGGRRRRSGRRRRRARPGRGRRRRRGRRRPAACSSRRAAAAGFRRAAGRPWPPARPRRSEPPWRPRRARCRGRGRTRRSVRRDRRRRARRRRSTTPRDRSAAGELGAERRSAVGRSDAVDGHSEDGPARGALAPGRHISILCHTVRIRRSAQCRPGDQGQAMRILIVGAGGVGARRPRSSPPVATSSTSWSPTTTFFARATALGRRIGDARYSAAQVDAGDAQAVAALCREHGVTHVLNVVDPRFVLPIFEGAARRRGLPRHGR